MILVDKQILKKVSSGKLGIEPFRVDRVQPNSYDVSLSQNFTYIGRGCNDVLDVKDKNTYDLGAVSVHRSSIILTPGEFVLGETSEKVQLPDNIVASIEGKSSLARLGLQIHQTGGWIDAGFAGTITLELYNASPRPIKLYAGMPIGQLVFFKTKHCAIPYSRMPHAKYYQQTGATTSKYYENFK